MAVSLQTLLNIVANVKGERAVAKLGDAVGGIKAKAAAAATGLTGLTNAVGGLAGALTMLTPLLSGAGLIALAGGALQSADALADMSQRTGVSVEMLAKFKNAAELSGASIQTVEKGLVALSRSMAAAAAVDMGGMTEEEVDQAVKALEKGGEQQVKATEKSAEDRIKVIEKAAERQIDVIEDRERDKAKAVEDGEKAQTDAVDREAEARMAALSQESDRRLRELDRRYRREQQLQDDAFSDAADRANEAASDELERLIKQARRIYQARRKAIQDNDSLSDEAKTRLLQNLEDQQDAEVELIRDQFDRAKKIRDRAARDEQQALRDQREDRKQIEVDAINAEEEAKEQIIKDQAETRKQLIKDQSEAQKQLIKDQSEAQKQVIRDQSAAQVEILREQTREMVAAIKEGVKEAVAAMNAKLPKNVLAQEMEDMELNAGKAARAFKAMGIQVVDSAGNLRDPSAVMLEISDRLAKMPDGANKTALAMTLMRGAGKDLIPMLNEGSDAIKRLETGMTTGFAKASEAYGDDITEIGQRTGRLGLTIMAELLPVLESATNALAAFLDGFAKLPDWLQGAIGIIGGLALAFVGLAAPIMLTAKAIGGLVAWFSGSPLAAAIAGFITWPALLVAALIGAGVAIFVFRDEIMAFLDWFWKASRDALNAIGGMLYDLLVEPFIRAWTNMRDAVAPFFTWLGGAITAGLTTLGQLFTTYLVQPFLTAWTNMGNAVVAFFTGLGATITAGLTTLGQLFTTYLVQPFLTAWTNMGAAAGAGLQVIQEGWQGFLVWFSELFAGISEVFNQAVVQPMATAFDVVVETGKAALRGLLTWMTNAINGAIQLINGVIAGYNALPAPNIGYIPPMTVPTFAEGGFVDGPTLGVVGEAGPEYIVPQAKAAAFASNILAGVRGPGAIPSGTSRGGGGAPVSVNIRTGPVMQAGGQDWVSKADMAQAVSEAVRQTRRMLVNPADRADLGIA
jgi:hypothetical protein